MYHFSPSLLREKTDFLVCSNEIIPFSIESMQAINRYKNIRFIMDLPVKHHLMKYEQKKRTNIKWTLSYNYD